MENTNAHHISILEDDQLIFSQTVSRIAIKESSAPSEASHALIQSILEKMHKRESELPFLPLDWLD